eukprot:NODE_630_length_5791_cov_0.338370.p2 type:complete len:338 gc:universal NODE_630_length_5791_cov_0.338370:1621-608(-)
MLNIKDQFSLPSSPIKQTHVPIATRKTDYLKQLHVFWEDHPYKTNKIDKIFSSVWLNERDLLIGTKCNRLLLISEEKVIPIPTMFPTPDPDYTTHTTSYCQGIHSLVLNPSKTLMGVSGGKPYEILIMRLPELIPIAVCQGHDDLVFQLEFIDDHTLASCSRDMRVGLWELSSTYYSGSTKDQLPIFRPKLIMNGHSGRVRDLAVDHFRNQVYTCSADQTCKIWDLINGEVISTFKPEFGQEMISSSISHNIYAVGSQTHVTVYDSRMGKIIHSVEGKDEGWGIRSLILHNDLLTIGGGKGRISFYDFTARDYLPIADKSFHVSGEGWFVFTSNLGL